MARICELTGVGPRKGSIIWRSGKKKKLGGIGTHVTAITKRKFMPNLQRVKALIEGEVSYIRVTTRALKKGMVVVYADGNGRVRSFKVTEIRIVTPDKVDWAIAAQATPSMTLQTCIGPRSDKRLLVRLVATG